MTSTATTVEPEKLGDVLDKFTQTNPDSRHKADSDKRLRDSSNAWIDARRQAGQRYAACTFDSYRVASSRQNEAMQAVRTFAAIIGASGKCDSGLVLVGPVGTGKDHLMFCAMREAAKSGLTVAWRNGIDWFGTLRDAIDKGERESEQISQLLKPDVLAFSDPVPPTGDLTSYQGQMLLRVIDRRYRHGKPTWVTMNVKDEAEAMDRIGPQAVDRLCDGALVVLCDWESFRAPSRIVNPPRKKT